MKKLFTLWLGIIGAAHIYAYDAKIGDLYYNLFSGETPHATITYKSATYSNGKWTYDSGLMSYNTTINIPDSITYNNVTYKVTSIGGAAFYNAWRVKTITIPSCVTNIGEQAFYACTGLTSVTIPQNVKNVGSSAFYDVKSVYVPCSLSVPHSKWGATSISYYEDYLIYEDREKTILCGCFENAKGEISIPNGVIEIKDNLFFNRTGITSIIIPEGLTKIGMQAFASCTGIKSISIPSTITEIGKDAFYNCTNIDNIYISDLEAWCRISFANAAANPLYYQSYGYSESYANKLYINNQHITDLEIPLNITTIKAYAFRDGNFNSITIHQNVTSIENYAFYRERGICQIICLAITPAVIGTNVFPDYCSIYVPCNTLDNYKLNWSEYSNAIKYKQSTYNYIINTNNYSAGIVQYTTPTICDETITIEAIPNSGYSFTQWSDGSIENPRSVELNSDTTIRAHFNYVINGVCGDDNLLTWTYDSINKTLTIEGNGMLNSNYTFGLQARDQMEKLIISEGVTSIGGGAFYNCTNLTSVIIGNSVTGIGDDVFSGCINLPIIDNVRYADTYLIGAVDRSLSAYTIKEGTKWINKQAFSGCSNVESIDIPSSVINIGENAFLGISNINYTGTATGAPWGALKINGEQPVLSVSEIKTLASNLGYNETSQDYYRFTGVISSINEVNTTYGNATFNITDGVNTFYCYRIHDYHSTLFTSSDQLNIGDSVVISSKVQNYKGTTPEATQGRLVYHSANPLFTPDSIYYYGHRKNYPGELKLYEAIDMDTLDIPSTVLYNGLNYTVTEMASGAFYNKENLKCVKLPKTLKLMPRAFEKCSNIQSLYFNARNLEQQTTIPFAESNTTLRTIYIGENVSSLPHEFFNNLTNITSVYWNAIACYDMQYSPFYYSRNSIRDFFIANNIEYIPANMCWGMTNLVEFKIPSRVTAIGKDAFHGCTGLTSLSLGENITSYGDSVFAGCSALTSIYNYRERPAKLSTGTFDGVDYFNCTLYVLAGSVNMYKSSGSDWKDFYFVEPIGAASTTTDEVVVTPHDNTADIVWPAVSGAATYELVIKDKSGNVICTLIFNANGQLTSIAFAPSRNGAPQQTQAAGFSFTVTGLEEGTSYDLTITSKDNNGGTLDTKTVSFTTTGEPQGIEDVLSNQVQCTKILHNGQIFILRGDKTYTLQGQEVK